MATVYDQEESACTLDYGSGTPIDVNSAPLPVMDYQVSAKAILLVPSNCMSGVYRNTDLQWTVGFEINKMQARMSAKTI